MMTSLFVVRHGESTWNADRRWQGRADPPLSERGERQARSAAIGQLGDLNGVVTSSLRRARDTGALIAEISRLPLREPVAALAERSAGPWEGLTRAEIDQRFPGYLAEGRRPDGYEPDESVVARALAALESLATVWVGHRLMVVTHGGVIHALERHVAVETGEWRRLGNLEGRWFHYEDRSFRAESGRLHLLDPDHDVSEPDSYV